MDSEKIIAIAIASFFVGLLLLIFVLPIIGLAPNYSDGERTGEIYKFSKKGLFWKSWEGAMYLGAVSSGGDGLGLDKFYFSIPVRQEGEKRELIEKINTCARERKICTIQYNKWFISRIFEQGSGYTVSGVK